MKSEDLRRYRSMLEHIELEVGRFHLAFGCPGMVKPERGRPEEPPSTMPPSNRNNHGSAHSEV